VSELVLTPTDRLARALREDYAVAQQRAGKRVWQPPEIKSLRQWVQDCWTQSWPAEQLLNSSQQLALWLEAIEAGDHSLISPRSCAREAMHAARVAAQWKIDPGHMPAWTDEHRAWQAWHQQVRQRMQSQGWIVTEDIIRIVTRWMKDGSLQPPAPTRLHGFTAGGLCPLEQDLLDALNAFEQVSHHSDVPVEAMPARGLLFTDSRQQYRFIASTIRDRLQACMDDESLLPRILVVCPEDADSRRALEAALDDLVAPWQKHPDGPDAVPWRWHNGHPLNEFPWVDAALAILALGEYDNRPEIISRLLLSATLWPDELRETTARIDFRLRDQGFPKPSLHALLHELGDDEETLSTRLAQLREQIQNESNSALPSEWARQFENRLKIMGWPGDNALSSSAFQTVREFRTELARLASLDSMVSATSINGARTWLNELCQRRFTPRAEHLEPVHILTPRDLEDIRLDQEGDLLIFCDASADHYPGTINATPFLPVDVQMEAGIPEARADSWLAAQQQRLTNAVANSRETLLCVCTHNDEGADLLPTPLLNIDWQPADETATPLSATEQMAAMPAPVVLPDDDPVPPVSAGENIHGSTDLFKAWAESPFLAFCKVRLKLQPLPLHGRGLPNHIQGTLLHEALDQIMGERVETSAQLHNLDEGTLGSLVSETLGPLIRRKLSPVEYGRELIRLEEGRMQDLLVQWLKHEQRRIHPFRVVEHENDLNGELAGLPLRLRVDRVDQVTSEQGERYLVIDYKTGREVKPGGWKQDSLKEPQLPLYAILGTRDLVPQVDGICFAHLKDGHPALSACTNWTLGLIPNDKAPNKFKLEDWPDLLNDWQRELTQIAADFMAGVATLDASKVQSRGFYADYLLLAGEIATGEEEL